MDSVAGGPVYMRGAAQPARHFMPAMMSRRGSSSRTVLKEPSRYLQDPQETMSKEPSLTPQALGAGNNVSPPRSTLELSASAINKHSTTSPQKLLMAQLSNENKQITTCPSPPAGSSATMAAETLNKIGSKRERGAVSSLKQRTSSKE